ncbi:hypothetical protein [Chitinimonas sp.]|uniref:hypothetical protein n=1 Tax=Chitinimonas sp. TaxID=1934313 RepID=UPI0035B439F5
MDIVLMLLIFAAICALPLVIPYLAVRATESENAADAGLGGRNSLGLGKTLARLLVVGVCYLLSGYGLLFSMMAIAEVFRGNIIYAVLLYAWLCHVVMSLGWVVNIRVARFWPISGTIAGVASFLLIPLVGGQSSQFGFDAVIMEVLTVAPCLFLGFHLVSFHLKHSNRTRVAGSADSREGQQPD